MITLTDRPNNFNDNFIGQDKIKKEMKYHSINFTYPQVMLFGGSTGCGKTTACKIIAKTLNCKNPIKLENGEHIPCETCKSCKSINDESYTSGGVIVLKSNINSGKDDAIDLESRVYEGSIFDSKKIFIIEECHNLSPKAQEVLLTLIEKPFKDIYFILLTTELEKIKATIKNRCQPYLFKDIPIEELYSLGIEVLKKRGIFDTVPESFIFDNDNKCVLNIIASNSKGSVRHFLQYLERCIVSELYTLKDIEESFDFTSIETIYEILTKIAYKDKTAFTLLEQLKNFDDFYYKSRVVLLDTILYQLTGLLDNWKKPLSDKLIKSGNDIKKLFSLINEIKTYPFVDKYNFYEKIINWFDLNLTAIVPPVNRGRV